MQGIEELLAPGDPLSLSRLALNLGLGVVFGILLRWHFNKFASTLSNRKSFAQVFLFILLTTILIITVVKSSLALSLGLVGALSIVRFRTPIKEPEELAYLFMAIATGLGLGADQTLPTVVAVPAILAAVGVFKLRASDRDNKNLYLSVRCGDSQVDAGRPVLVSINEILGKHTLSHDMRRIDSGDGKLEATFFVDILGSDELVSLMDDLQRSVPGLDLTFIDQNRLPSV